MKLWPGVVAMSLWIAACEPNANGPGTSATPGSSTPAHSATAASASAAASSKPAPSSASAPTASSTAAPAAASGNCYPAAKSRDYGSVTTAAAPFTDCAAMLKVHCGGADGERGGLHGLTLIVEETAAARKRNPDACCYRSCE